MSWDGYLCLGGVEIINSSRTCQFIADGIKPEGLECRNCCPCPDVDRGLGYENGYSRTDTPWYAPPKAGQRYGGADHLDSLNFGGILVTDIQGLEPGAFSRPVTESAGYGAVIGQGRQSAPQITVTGLLMASTCCAQEYGYRWLRSALRGSCKSASQCSGDDLVFLSCQPETPDLDCLDDADALNDCLLRANGDPDAIAQCNIDYATPFDFEEWLTPYVRTMKGVSLIGDVTRTTIPRACPDCYDCAMIQVQFTLAASKPCIYHEPETLVEDGTFVCDTDEECIEWITTADRNKAFSRFVAQGKTAAQAQALVDAMCGDCDTTSDCATDPDCVSTSAPPTIPPITNPCDVDCLTDETCSICVDIPAGTFPINGEGTVIVTIDNTAGSAPIKKIKLRVWQNPLELDAVDLEDCDVCSELNISYLAPGARLVIDGANQTANIECPGGDTVRANPFISSGSGSPSFTYPSIDGCSGLHTICIQAAGPVGPETVVTIQTVGREC